MLGTIIEHLLGLGETSDEGTGEALAAHHETEGMHGGGLGRNSHEAEGAFPFQEAKVGVEIMVGRDGIEDEVETMGKLGHRIGVRGEDNLMGAETLSVGDLGLGCREASDMGSE